MTRFVLLMVTLTVVYLLVLTSVEAGDILVGAALSAVLAGASMLLRPAVRIGPPLGDRLAAVPALVFGTLADMVRGTWHVALYVLRDQRLESPGIVAIPKGERTGSGVAVWGYITAVSPDEIVVDVDGERDVLLVHVLDARDASAHRARHQHTYERRQRRVFP